MKRARILCTAMLLLALLSPNTASNGAVTGAPSAPQNITQTANSTGVLLSWGVPAYTGASGVTSYRIEYSTTGSAWTLANTITDTSTTVGGLSPSTTYYFRVAAYSSSTRGANGYPWTKVYGTTAKNRNSSGAVDYETGYGVTVGDTATATNTFTRVRYLLNTTISSTANYADVDFEEWALGNSDSATSVSSWAPTLASIRIPTTLASNQYLVQANVNDLNVYSDNALVSNGYGMLGRLEIWPWNYSYTVSGLKPVGDNTVFDYDDYSAINGNTTANAGTYGSFQVHDIDNRKPVFVWNNHGNTATAEVGYGKNPTSGSNPDWTFCSQGGGYGSCPSPSSFRLQIFVNNPITTLASLITTASVSVSANPQFRKSSTISYSTTTPGKVTFLEAGKVIAGCKNISVISTASCSWKPSKRNAQVISARLTPTNGALSAHTSSSTIFISSRSSAR